MVQEWPWSLTLNCLPQWVMIMSYSARLVTEPWTASKPGCSSCTTGTWVTDAGCSTRWGAAICDSCSGVYGGVRHKHCGKSYNKNNHLTDYLLLTGYVVIILCFWINLSSISWGTKIYTGGVGGFSSARTRKLGLSSINNIRLCLIIIP